MGDINDILNRFSANLLSKPVQRQAREWNIDDALHELDGISSMRNFTDPNEPVFHSDDQFFYKTYKCELPFVEVAIAMKFSHPNLMSLEDFYLNEAGTELTLKMRKADSDMSKWIKNDGRALINDLRGVAEAIIGLHKSGFIHNDIKPENIFMFGNTPVLGDFGFTHKLSIYKSIIATPMYASREKLLKTSEFMYFDYPDIMKAVGKIDHDPELADSWEFGVVLYHAAFGKHPYPVPEDMEPNERIALRLVRQRDFITRLFGVQAPRNRFGSTVKAIKVLCQSEDDRSTIKEVIPSRGSEFKVIRQEPPIHTLLLTQHHRREKLANIWKERVLINKRSYTYDTAIKAFAKDLEYMRIYGYDPHVPPAPMLFLSDYEDEVETYANKFWKEGSLIEAIINLALWISKDDDINSIEFGMSLEIALRLLRPGEIKVRGQELLSFIPLCYLLSVSVQDIDKWYIWINQRCIEILKDDKYSIF